MPGHPCKICSSSELSRRCQELIASGLSDAQVAAQLGDGVTSRAGVNRHRRTHLLPVTRAIVEAGSKDAPAKAERGRLLEAAENGTLNPADYLSLSAIVSELKGIGSRLERTAAAAESGGQYPVAVSAAAQQIRLNESKARLAGHGGFAPARNRDGGDQQPTLHIVFHFSDGRREEITAINDARGGEVIGNEPVKAVDLQPHRPREVTTVVNFPELEPVPASDNADAVVDEEV